VEIRGSDSARNGYFSKDERSGYLVRFIRFPSQNLKFLKNKQTNKKASKEKHTQGVALTEITLWNKENHTILTF